MVFHSYGVVAVNKPLSSMEIEVTPMEELTMTDGELTDNISTQNFKGTSSDGTSFETTVKSSATITARWLAFGSNRATAPDVRRGEKVAIYKFGDADKYYWGSLEYDAKLRKLETVIFMFSDTRDEDAEATKDNTYYLEISSHSKIVHFHTSKSDGEPYTYDVMFDLKEGVFSLRDDLENIIFLSSAEKRIAMKNASGSFIDLIDKNLNINVVQDMNVTIGGNYSMDAAGTWKTKASNSDFTTAKLKTSAILESGGNTVVGASLSTGAAGGGGNSTIGGTLSVQGSLTVQGQGSFSGTVSAPNIN